MAHYIAYATERGTTVPQRMKEQVIAMLSMGLWCLPASAQLKTKLLRGDGLIVAVGAPYREFVGDAVLGSRYRPFSQDEISALPAGLKFDHGLTLIRARVWSEPIPIEAIWERVTAARSNPGAHFLGAVNTVRSKDAALIVSAGVSRGTTPEAAGAVEREGVTVEAEDARIIAVMNTRRATQGKPPLTPEQEQQVRANRRADREREPPS
jgi:hypothetical protein